MSEDQREMVPEAPGEVAPEVESPPVVSVPIRKGHVKMFHPKTGASKVVSQAAYEECWVHSGWTTEDTSSDPTEELAAAESESDETAES